jgi:NO-binding membrane sensor protein with MHYT domain
VKAPSFGVILVAAFAIGTGLNGLYTGVTDLPTAPNTLATMVGVINIVMGITGLGAAVQLWRQHRLAVPLVIAWGASAIALSILRPRANAPEAGWPVAIVGGVMTAAIVVTIVLYVRWRLGPTALGKSSPAS